MFGLAVAMVAIALPDSLNPSLIAAEIYLALGPHPVRRTLAFTVAAFCVTLAGGLAIALGLGDLVVSLLPKFSRTTKWTVVTGAGLLLLCSAPVIWCRRDALADSEPPSRRRSAHKGGSPILIGAGIAGVELFTAFPYFAAIALLLGSSVPFGSKALLLVLYNVVYVAPLITIVVVCALLGEKGARRLAPVGDWLAMRWPLVVAPLVGVVGIGLLVYGLVQLS